MNAKTTWRRLPLGDFAETHYGTAEKANEVGRGLPILRMGNLDDRGAFDLTDLKHIELAPEEVERYTVRRGDLLFNRTNSAELVGKLGHWDRDEPYAYAGYLVRVRVDPAVAVPAYVAAFFNTPHMKRTLRARAKPSINMSNLSAGELMKFEVPLPPLSDQQRIAAILEQAHALLEWRQTTIGCLLKFLRATFVERFGDLISNDKGWPVRTVADFVATFESGKNVVADEHASDHLKVLKVSAVTALEYRPEEAKPAPAGYAPPQSHYVRIGDLLFSRANTEELIGATAYVFSTPPNLLLPDKLWRFVWHSVPKAEPLFVWHLFQQPSFRRELGKRATGTSGSMKNISQEKVLKLRVGLPPLPLQREFAAQVEAIEQLKAAQLASFAKLDELFASLQYRAFRGEL